MILLKCTQYSCIKIIQNRALAKTLLVKVLYKIRNCKMASRFLEASHADVAVTSTHLNCPGFTDLRI
jgi:hypothetical protein